MNDGNGQLRAFVERLERLDQERESIVADFKEVMSECKANGYDTKIVRRVLRLRKQDPNERLEQEALLETYLAALGMISVPPEE